MKKIFYYLPSIIFNVTEFLVVILIGILLEIRMSNIIITILVFFIVRMLAKKALHYKSWKLCLLWSVLQMTSLFLTSMVGIHLGIISTIFAAIVLSGIGDIRDIFMWNGEHSLNKEVFEWVKFNQNNDKLKEYEEKGNTVDEIKKQIQEKEIVYPDTMSSVCQDFIANVLY